MTAWFPVLVVWALAPPQPSDELAPPIRLMAGSKPINVEVGHAAPFYADIDGSGTKSLLVGQYGGGKLRIYHNCCTAKEPKFDNFTWFLDGKPEGTVPYGWCIGFTPQVVGLDGDGQVDIISGSWPGELYFFKGQGNGRFAAREKFKDGNGKEINLGNASTVFAADRDGDGVPDLIVGDIGGNVWLVPNGGTAKKPAFGSPRKLKANGKIIQAPHGDSHPVVADWDGDGLPDLIVGAADGCVQWYRNVGTAKEPKLHDAKVLVPESDFGKEPPGPLAKEKPCKRVKVCVVDWDGDGRPDLLVGDYGDSVTEASKLTPEEEQAKKKAQEEHDKLCKEYQPQLQEQNNLFQEPSNEQPAAKAEREKKLQAVQAKLKPFNEKVQKLYPAMFKGQPKVETHGHVWLYLRKPAKAE